MKFWTWRVWYTYIYLYSQGQYRQNACFWNPEQHVKKSTKMVLIAGAACSVWGTAWELWAVAGTTPPLHMFRAVISAPWWLFPAYFPAFLAQCVGVSGSKGLSYGFLGTVKPNFYVLDHEFSFLKNIFIGVWLMYNVVIVSGVQQSESVIHIHISTLFFRFFSRIDEFSTAESL